MRTSFADLLVACEEMIETRTYKLWKPKTEYKCWNDSLGLDGLLFTSELLPPP